MAKLSTDNVFNIFDASICAGTVRAEPIFAKQSEIKRIKMINSRSAGPLISKLRKSELARKRPSVSSMISACSGSATCDIQRDGDGNRMKTYQGEQDHGFWF